MDMNTGLTVDRQLLCHHIQVADLKCQSLIKIKVYF